MFIIKLSGHLNKTNQITKRVYQQKKQIMQKIHPQMLNKEPKKPNSQSFGTDRSSSVLNQFLLKTKQILVDDFKVRKVYQSVRPISQNYKNELRQFMKNFNTKPKDEFIELCYHLIQKYVDFANLKIYLWYFREGKEMGQWQEAFLFSGLLDSFSHSILSEQNQKELNKSLQTEETRSKKPSVVFSESSDTFDDILISPVKLGLKRQESLPQQIEAEILEGTKESKDILKPLDKLFDSLSKGDLEQAAKQKFPVSTASKLKDKKDKFIQRCQIIKRVIEYLNTLISTSDRVKPEISLKSLQKCMERLNKSTNKPKKGQRQKLTGQSSSSEKDTTKNDSDKKSIQSLEESLCQAQKLFNDKSMQLSMQRMKLGKEINDLKEKLGKINEQNIQLQDEVYELKKRLQEKQKQLLNTREDYFNKLKQKIREFEVNAKEQMKKQLQKKTQIIDDLTAQLQQSASTSNLKERTEEENIQRLNRVNDALKRQIQQLKVSLSKNQSKILELEQQNIKLSENLNLKDTERVSNSAKITALEQKEKSLKNQIKQLQQKFEKLNISYNDQNTKLQSQQKFYQKIISKSVDYILMNSFLESSEILPPSSYKKMYQSILSNQFFMSENSLQKRRQILEQKKLASLVQKEYLVHQIQKYVSRIQSSSKVKAFKLIYRLNSDIKANFHQYIDEKPCFLVLVKLKSGAVVGGYSHEPLKKGVRTQLGFIFSLSLLQSYFLKEKYCVVYDEYYLIFGNSQIRIRIGQNIFYSNFGITKASFQVNDRNFTDFLMVQNDREQVMEYFQIYQISFESS